MDVNAVLKDLETVSLSTMIDERHQNSKEYKCNFY